MKRLVLLTILSLSAAAFCNAQEEFAPMFPFQPAHDAPDNVTNVKTWSGVDERPAGADGFIRAEGDHFVDGSGKERRFLGTNICFTGCFPEHEDADRVAAELARYGINIVRLHYVHHKFPANKEYPERDSFLEPEQLERFDYFFSKLKENGIYTYFQLNIARKFGAQNGFRNADKLPWYNNGIDNVDKRMIELQEKYHKDILNHVNPYTGLAYKDEPAISMLELSNENSIVSVWFKSKYDFANLVEPYAGEMKAKWNGWLAEKYHNTRNLKAAWCSDKKGGMKEMLPDGMMGAGLKSDKLWGLQLDKLSSASWEVLPSTPQDKLRGSSYARIQVEKGGSAVTIPQFYRTGIKLKRGERYRLSLKLRSSAATTVSVRFSQDHDPWAVAGLNSKVGVPAKWQEFSFNFTSNMDDDRIRFVLSNLTAGNSFDIADVSLEEGGQFEWPEKASLEKRNIDWPHPSEWSFPMQRALDFTAFLSSLENSYFDELRRNIKNEIKPHQPLAGTQLHYGCFLPQAKFDYCDNHSYWNHPMFPGRSFDYSNWTILSRALVNGAGSPGTNLTNLARARVLGRPYTISEYDHPSANFYSAEGDVMASAMGAFQDWSGIMQFAWTHNTDYYRKVLSQSFDLCSATQKLVHFPACWAMFVRGDVSRADDSCVAVWTSTQDGDRKEIALDQATTKLSSDKNPAMNDLPLMVKAGTRVAELPELYPSDGHEFITSASQLPEGYRKAYASKEVVSSTGEITWNWKVKNAGYFKVDTRNTKAFTGFVHGRTFEFKGMSLTPGRTRLDWLTLTMTLTNPHGDNADAGTLKPGTYLLAATGLCQNTGTVAVNLDEGKKISTALKMGGNPGKAPILCEGIEATLAFRKLSGRVSCFVLDGTGARVGEVPVIDNPSGDAVLQLSPAYKTVWYEVVVTE